MIKLWLLALIAGLFAPAVVAGEAVSAEGSTTGAATRAPDPDTGDATAGSEFVRIEPGASGIDLEDAWVRAMPPFQPNSAGYLTVVNRRETAIAIIGASSSVARKTELHTTRMVDGLMRMEQLDGMAVAPGERARLEPGGKHLMLIGLAFRPVPGDDITLCLQLLTGEEICTRADVRRDDNAPAHNH